MTGAKVNLGLSYAAQLGLRVRALRVYSECSRIYREIQPAAAVNFIPKIRIDHYYPWVFTDDFSLPNSALRILAVGNVLLSDGVLGTLNAMHGEGVFIQEEEAAIYRTLIEHATRHFDLLLGNNTCFKQRCQSILVEQLAAIETERQLLADERLLSDIEAEQHAQRKAVYLKITLHALGELSSQPAHAAVVAEAQDQLTVALDLYNALLHWRGDIRQYRANRVLNLLRERGCDYTDPNHVAHTLYETELGNLVLEQILTACRRADEFQYKSEPFRSIIQWMVGRIRRLQADFQALRERVNHANA